MRQPERITLDTKNEQKDAQETLYSIIDIQRTPSPEYQSLISRQEKRDANIRGTITECSVVWGDLLSSHENPETNFFRQHLSDQTLVDLGGAKGWMSLVAHKFGCQNYINVERAPYDRPVDVLNPPTITAHETKKNCTDLRVHSDMLAFVSRMRDEIGSFAVNGIDNIIVDDTEYNRALAQELIRATKNGGILFGAMSEVLAHIDYLIKEKGAPLRLIKKQPEDESMGLESYIFEKTK